MQLTGYGITHQGNVRQNNEDNFYLFGKYRKDVNLLTLEEEGEISDEKALVGVFDGMGGEEAGEIASLIAAEGVEPAVIEMAETEALKQLQSINENVCREIIERNARVGTTAVLLYFDKSEVVSVNIGDSRAYCFRDDKLIRLSKDHSEGQNMVENGMLSEEEAKKNNAWHKLIQYIGIFPEEFIIEPYSTGRRQVNEGDLYLLCSDGLTDMLSDEDIASIIRKKGMDDLKETAHLLLDSALSSGGKDNVTIVLIRAEKQAPQNIRQQRGIRSIILGIILAAVLILGIVLGLKELISKNKEKEETQEIQPNVEETIETGVKEESSEEMIR